MTSDVLHIVFTASGAAILRPALREAGRDDRVIALMDSLSFGPINPPNREMRAKWVEEELGYTGWNKVGAESDVFWTAPEWRKAAFVIGKSLVDIWDTEFHQTDDLVLASHLRALVDSGRLESRGDLLHIRHSEVRLRSDLVHGLK